MTTNVAMLYLCWFNSFLTDQSAVRSFDGYVIVNTSLAVWSIMHEYVTTSTKSILLHIAQLGVY